MLKTIFKLYTCVCMYVPMYVCIYIKYNIVYFVPIHLNFIYIYLYLYIYIIKKYQSYFIVQTRHGIYFINDYNIL